MGASSATPGLRSLREGGRFLELGKTDLRTDLEVDYRALDLLEAGPERIQEMLQEARVKVRRVSARMRIRQNPSC